MATALPPTLAQAPRRRGRPRGAKTRLLRHEGALGVHHFAFLRSWFLGLDLRAAWARYMAFAELSDDLRHIEHRRAALLRQVLEAAHQANLVQPADARLTAELALLARAPLPAASTALPSLDDFAAAHGLDREFHSEAELQHAYREFFHLDTAADERPPAPPAAALDAVRALHRVERLLARPPAAEDRVDRWFSPALAGRLKQAGIGTLGALADTVRVAGPRWRRQVPGLGETRARALLEWLAPVAEAFGRPLPAPAMQPEPAQRALQAATLRQLVIPPRFGLVALERLQVPPPLAGGAQHPGRFATRLPNHLGAGNDLQALQAWLAPYRETPPTWRAYRKEAERFYLWCVLERRKPLSSIDAADCLAYRQFLAAVPAGWINPVPTPRADPGWRPFRGPLAPVSQKYALVVVQAMFDGLGQANYLVGNPMATVNKKVALRHGGIDAERSFTTDEWAFVLGQLARAQAAAGPDGRGAPQLRRLRLLLELLAATGLRLAEIAGARMADIRTLQLDGEASPAHLLRVLGKGGKEREVPVDDALRVLIARHHEDAARTAALPSPAPIVCTLGERPRRWAGAPGGGWALEPRAAPVVLPLGTAGIYQTLKRFLRRIARDAHAVDGLSRQRLEAASTHWLRHTFGRQGAAAGVPIEVLRQAFGHASLNTTSVYVNTERARMVRELRRLRPG